MLYVTIIKEETKLFLICALGIFYYRIKTNLMFLFTDSERLLYYVCLYP
jgi:hypothetical protein